MWRRTNGPDVERQKTRGKGSLRLSVDGSTWFHRWRRLMSARHGHGKSVASTAHVACINSLTVIELARTLFRSGIQYISLL